MNVAYSRDPSDVDSPKNEDDSLLESFGEFDDISLSDSPPSVQHREIPSASSEEPERGHDDNWWTDFDKARTPPSL